MDAWIRGYVIVGGGRYAGNAGSARLELGGSI
jgi:hypothetical protein